MIQRVLPVGLLLLASIPSAAARAQTPRVRLEAPDATLLDGALAQWRAENGDGWRLARDPETGWMEMLYGARTASGVRPADDAQFAQRALAMLEGSAALHGIDLDTLVLLDVHFLPLAQIGSSDKVVVKFRQQVGGVRVQGGFVNVLFDLAGSLLSIQTSGLPKLSGFDTAAKLSADQGLRRALLEFQKAHGVAATRVGEPELVIEEVLAAGRRVPHLCWRVDVQWHQDGVDPIGEYMSLDARDGTLVERAESVHFFDISGNVKAMSSPGLLPDIASNPEAAQVMPYMRVTSSAGNATTDANGNFTIVGANAATPVTFAFVGTFNNVVNNAGAAYTMTQTLQPAQANNVTLNPSSSASVTAQANAFRSIDLLRDFVRAIDPGDSRADFVTSARVNVSGSCNAFYDGGALNFFPASGGCVNSAYSTVVSHEHGHWMNDLYSTGNGSDGMGEGNADVWSMYVHDTPIIGMNFSGSSSIRTGLNTRQFCGDLSPGCYGEVHNDGEVWMGAAWKVRANLNTSLGSTAGDLAANTLFLAWMNAYNQGGIRSIIETQWATLDDDNGSLDDGTPNFAAIDNGFRAQGFPGLAPPCPAPVHVCTTSPNSVGTGALLSSLGSTHVSRNDFMLWCLGCRPSTTGIFFYGQVTTQVPFGNGVRCIDNPFFRLPATQANIFGEFFFPLNLNTLPVGGHIASGQTWVFQCYYRDIAGGGAGFNASDALSTTWCP